MFEDVIQLIIWAVIGLFITWGIFYAYVGFRMVSAQRQSKVARVAAFSALTIGIFWITLWVSAVVWNVLQIIGVIET